MYLVLWRSVFERQAPLSLTAQRRRWVTGLRQGGIVKGASDVLFTAVTLFYEKAAKG